MIKKYGILVLLSLVMLSCGKDSGSTIPSIPVNFQAALTDTRISKLNSAGGAVTVAGYGVAGLLIYRDATGGYHAYDRCSSYEPQNKCAVTIDDTGFTVTDPCSGSKVSLNDGSPVKAPASKSLRVYDAYVVNFQLFVSN
jgi:nitrite reductase/ring-hydroxylating ferredoxin subunit